MTQAESNMWEFEHFNEIIKWTAEYDIKPGIKVITFVMTDKTTVTHEIILNPYV